MLPAFFNIIGSSDPPLEVALYCIGEGPVVYVTPDELHWGVCPVLTPISKMVRLSNESLIPAEFECVLVSKTWVCRCMCRCCYALINRGIPIIKLMYFMQAREKTIFNVDPISAVIAPKTSLYLRVTALVDDCLKLVLYATCIMYLAELYLSSYS